MPYPSISFESKLANPSTSNLPSTRHNTPHSISSPSFRNTDHVQQCPTTPLIQSHRRPVKAEIQSNIFPDSWKAKRAKPRNYNPSMAFFQPTPASHSEKLRKAGGGGKMQVHGICVVLGHAARRREKKEINSELARRYVGGIFFILAAVREEVPVPSHRDLLSQFFFSLLCSIFFFPSTFRIVFALIHRRSKQGSDEPPPTAQVSADEKKIKFGKCGSTFSST